jgi:hypothetical protein
MRSRSGSGSLEALLSARATAARPPHDADTDGENTCSATPRDDNSAARATLARVRPNMKTIGDAKRLLCSGISEVKIDHVMVYDRGAFVAFLCVCTSVPALSWGQYL